MDGNQCLTCFLTLTRERIGENPHAEYVLQRLHNFQVRRIHFNGLQEILHAHQPAELHSPAHQAASRLHLHPRAECEDHHVYHLNAPMADHLPEEDARSIFLATRQKYFNSGLKLRLRRRITHVA